MSQVRPAGGPVARRGVEVLADRGDEVEEGYLQAYSHLRAVVDTGSREAEVPPGEKE